VTNNTYYLYLSDSPNHTARRTTARAPNLKRALELVRERMPAARVWRIGLVTDVEYTMAPECSPAPSSEPPDADSPETGS